MLARFHSFGERADPVERLAVQAVVDPTAIPSVRHQTGILQNPEMEGEPRLRGVERVLQLADTPFAVRQQLDDLEPRLVRERMKPSNGNGALGKGGGRHERTISISVDTSRPWRPPLGTTIPGLKQYC